MDFGEAIKALKEGKRVARSGWNGKGMFLLYVPSEKWGIIDNIFNNRYEGDPKAGKVKVPVRDTEVEVKAYNKQTGATISQGSTSYFDLFNCKLFMNGQPSVLYDSYNKNMDWKILKIIRNQIRKCKVSFVFLQYLCRF